MAGSTRKGKPKGVYTEKRLAGIVPNRWKPGAPSPNPGGRPRQHREMVAKLRENADWIADAILAIIQKGLTGKLTSSDKILSQHIWETWQAMFGRHPQSVLLTGGLDVGDNPADMEVMGGLTALLRAVRQENQPKQPAQPHPPPEPDPALTRAEREISPMAVMLAQVRADSPDGEPASPREVLASLVGEERAAELIGEAVIVVDSAGTAVEPPPSPASAADRPIRPLPAAPASSAAEDPAPAPEEEPPASPPPPPRSERQPRRPSGFPDFDRFSAERARTRAADEERARKVEEARAQGRPQISREEAFPPDPCEGPEIVNFTRVPGGRGIVG
jgi:hypothetical protein